ncbi:MAG: hypothetical protein EPN97_17125 [Alphaproteobacteria bacterium]|nr:MAG: hypothetical protein EPN97_17125 [Alphaproteobacteria bacterium]
MTKDLNEVRDKLYKAFDKAMQGHDDINQYTSGTTVEKVSARSLALSAAAQTAQALTAVEHEIAVEKAYEDWQKSGGRIDDEIAGGIIRDVKAMATLKIKPPGGK